MPCDKIPQWITTLTLSHPPLVTRPQSYLVGVDPTFGDILLFLHGVIAIGEQEWKLQYAGGIADLWE